MKRYFFIAASLLLVLATGCKSVPEDQALEEYNARSAEMVETFNQKMTDIQNDPAVADDEKAAKIQEAYDEAVAELTEDGLAMLRKYPDGELAVTVLKNIAAML